jgi:UDP-N-acetylglucosamine diphosphorylase/glucosamine-1-phosphate N-acetyltransferase
MNYILFDDYSWDNLLPLTFTKPASELRIGIRTLREKWEHFIGQKVTWLTKDYLSEKYPIKIEKENILINGSVVPEEKLFRRINALDNGQALVKGHDIVAANLEKPKIEDFKNKELRDIDIVEYEKEITKINHPWQVFKQNGQFIDTDFQLITKDRESEEISATNNLIHPEKIFIEPGAQVEYATINATNGPVYIGKEAEIMEGSIIRGPFAMCEHAVLKLAAKIYGPTTLGPYCKVGGEVNNVVFTGYSNKAHDGFLGNSVIGEWCNLGADTNNSNLKNNYTEVRQWNYVEERFVNTGLQFCGLIMGDHSKCGINTMFNTGTVVGVNANIFGEGFPRNFIPSFSWGGMRGFKEYNLEKAFEVAGKVMSRRNKAFDDIEQNILTAIFEKTKKYRNFL